MAKPSDAQSKKKKKKVSPEEKHRQLQERVEALPYAITHLQGEGKWFRAGIVKYLAGPMLRMMNRMMDRQRYRGPTGQKLKQSEQMKRHLEQRRKAMEYIQGEMARAQKKAQKRKGPR
ncbi:MAG TPA: hypothetical protein VFQ45_19180 [Longimicrobium sp.]|nr:hypothetical protein [Longimicrobium sp.]